MANNEKIQPLKIEELFSSNDQYLIPIYQRNYAWEKGQVEQLIQDILDFSENKENNENVDKTYYIGTLVVFERKENNKTIYETIDGQQRLTTLSILLSVLKNKFNMDFDFKHLLSYESRESSNKTFDAINEKIVFNDDSNATMKNAYQTIVSKLIKIKENANLENFINYLLKHVEILRVSVPEDTDLNHYFEIMNNRGEQLEKHEVLKAQMLKKLEANDRVIFSKIWDACSDMSRYIQYSFSNEKEKKHREKIFGEKWNNFQISLFDDLVKIFEDEENDKSNDGLRIEEIINPENSYIIENEDDKNLSERFTSPINFQNFLLHVLRIQVRSANKDDIPLDDKRLLDTFEKYTLTEDFIKEFGFNLLKVKYLFDNYILKRDYSKNDEDGEWSLKKLLYGNSSAQYNNSFGEDNSDNDKIIKLLSMFHVSNPSQTYKYWLTGALNFLFYEDINNIKSSEYSMYLENQARLFLMNRYLSKSPTDYFEIIFDKPEINYNVDLSLLNNGTNVENFIFNYLDYLLWKDDKDNEFKNFHFTFRSSVEHFYPQNPLDGQKKLQDEFCSIDYLNSFGNLCLISASKNSKLTNLQPGGKESHYKSFDGISPKQYLMMKDAKIWWKDEIKKHQNEMLKVFGLDYKHE